MGKKREDTEWFTQQEITERTGCSASWVHAQGANGTVRRQQSGKYKGRPIYEYAYADIIREADAAKVQAYQEALQAVAKVAAPGKVAPRTVDALGNTVGSPPPNVAMACPPQPELEKLAVWLREGVFRNYVTPEQARAILAHKAKL